MSTIKQLHQSAMEQTDLALTAQRAGRADESRRLFKAAFELERQAVALIPSRIDAEPTRSILHRSAATLALDCGEYRQAEILICDALRGAPPTEIAEELRDLLEQVYFRRHLSLRGVSLTEAEIQMSIAGKVIGFGIAPIGVFLPRVCDAEKLVYRTAERLSGLQFRKAGQVSAPILNAVEMYATVPRESSFAVSFRLGQSAQLNLPGAESLSERTIDDIIGCLEIFNSGDEEQLRKMIPQPEYYNNFVGLARNLQPDGEEVTLVGFSAIRNGALRSVALTGRRAVDPVSLTERFAEPMAASSESINESSVRIEGYLKEADSRRSKQGRIQVVDEEGTSHVVVVPPEMMTDIVKPLWDSRVLVVGRRVKKAIHLEEITPLRPRTRTAGSGS